MLFGDNNFFNYSSVSGFITDFLGQFVEHWIWNPKVSGFELPTSGKHFIDLRQVLSLVLLTPAAGL